MHTPIDGRTPQTSPERSQSPPGAKSPPRSPPAAQGPGSPSGEPRRRMVQPLGLSNHNAQHGWKIFPQDLSGRLSQIAPPSAPSVPSAPRHRLHGLDLPGAGKVKAPHPKAPGADHVAPPLPGTDRAHRWFSLPSLSPETLKWLRTWLPVQLIPVASAIPGVVGGLRSAQGMATFRSQLEQRSQQVARQLQALGPIPTDDAPISLQVRQRQWMLQIEQEGLVAARRTANFHLAALGLEVVCIVVATLPTLVVTLRLAGQGRLVRALGVCMRALLLFNAVMNVARFAWGLYPLLRDAYREEHERPSLPAGTWEAWQAELLAERSYMARQLMAWCALSLGIVGVSGLVTSGWAALVGAGLLTLGIVASTAQHLLEGRRFDLPQALWAQPAPPGLDGPCSVFGALAFDPVDRLRLSEALDAQAPVLAQLREEMAALMRPQLRPVARLLPYLLRFEGLVRPLGWALRFGMASAAEAATAPLVAAQVALWQRERALLEDAIAQRRANLAVMVAPLWVAPNTLPQVQPQALECAQTITAAESELLDDELERIDRLEQQLVAPGPNDPPPMEVLAAAWDLCADSPELIGTLVWQMHAQHEAWRTGLVWCVKMAVLAEQTDAFSDSMGSPRPGRSRSPPLGFSSPVPAEWPS